MASQSRHKYHESSSALSPSSASSPSRPSKERRPGHGSLQAPPARIRRRGKKTSGNITLRRDDAKEKRKDSHRVQAAETRSAPPWKKGGTTIKDHNYEKKLARGFRSVGGQRGPSCRRRGDADRDFSGKGMKERSASRALVGRWVSAEIARPSSTRVVGGFPPDRTRPTGPRKFSAGFEISVGSRGGSPPSTSCESRRTRNRESALEGWLRFRPPSGNSRAAR